MADEAIGRVPLQLLRGRIVASIQTDLSDAVLRRFQTDLLTFVQASAATGVVLDVSGVEIMDVEEFNGLRGVYHSVSAKNLHGYLNEYVWRYNRRNEPRAMFLSLLLRAARP